MKLYIGADHQGYDLKEALLPWLREQGHEVIDLGAVERQPDDDYPDYAFAVAEAVAEQADTNRGIVICGSGIGVAMAAGKVPGIRSALIHDPAIAAAARADDDVNVLALGAAFIDDTTAQKVISAWLDTPFSGEARHQRRLQKITAYEEQSS